MGRNDPCYCGSGKKLKQCRYQIPKPPGMSDYQLKEHEIIIKNQAQIEGIRRSGHLAAEILTKTCERAKEGVTLIELNDYAHQLHLEAGAIPATLNYGHPPFPRSVCISGNEVICHGIADETQMKAGDIFNIDVTCILDGYYGDCSMMVTIGEISDEKRRVLEASYEGLMNAIKILKPGVALNEIANQIEAAASKYCCSVVDTFVGHGIGIDFHEGPNIFHHQNDLDLPLTEGMIFTIEPMINAGVRDAIIDESDGWTARTADGKPSAQWEHTLLITDSGVEILTPWKRI